jgi:hypothetical protein
LARYFKSARFDSKDAAVVAAYSHQDDLPNLQGLRAQGHLHSAATNLRVKSRTKDLLIARPLDVVESLCRYRFRGTALYNYKAQPVAGPAWVADSRLPGTPF